MLSVLFGVRLVVVVVLWFWGYYALYFGFWVLGLDWFDLVLGYCGCGR